MAERCKGLKKLDKYDVDGYVDDYRKDRSLSTYVTDLAESLNIPYYLLITLVVDKKMTKFVITIDYVQYVKTLLEKYVAKNGNLIGLKRGDVKAYEAFRNLIETYSDGSGRRFNAKEWLALFGLDVFKNRFKDDDILNEDIDISAGMRKLKEKFGDKQILLADIDTRFYTDILKYSKKYAITVKEVFARFGLNYKGITIQRLNHAVMDRIPYFEEMKALRDKLILESGISLENGNSPEEVFEAKVKAVQQAYAAFADKIMMLEDVNYENITDNIVVD